ncbi:MAG: ComEC/Rec2 family competence protein [Weissella confusa]
MGWLRLSAVDAWGIALLGGLLLEPGVLHNLGGQLSYLLTFGLLWLEGKPGWWQCVFLSLLILPLLLWHTYAWHPIGILANLIAMPLFTWLVIPVLTVGILAAWLNITALTNWCNAVVDGVRWTIAQTEGLPGELTFDSHRCCYARLF